MPPPSIESPVSNVRNLTTTQLHNLLEPISRKPSTSISNWSRTFQCTPACIFDPDNEFQCELILELAKRRGVPVRATGVGHSPSDIACTNGFLICTLRLNQLLEVSTPSFSHFRPRCSSPHLYACLHFPFHELHGLLRSTCLLVGVP